jgi:regulator of replication initiation timing
MNLFETLEKLISEHASAAVLRDHVALLKDQMAILDKENSALKQENLSLKKENSKLKAEKFNLCQQAEIAKAREQPLPKTGLIHDLDVKRRA